MRQWVLKITEYADRLLEGLEDLDWPESTKEMQRNWIGRSEGANVYFDLVDVDDSLTVYTTRPDTLFGATYMVLAPEHELLDEITTDARREEVDAYVDQALRKSERKRKAEGEKSGVFTGGYAVNPVNGEEIPIWVADYVLASYGTGAIMAVPAHDERDYAFATKYDLPIREVVEGGDIDEEAYVGDGPHVNSSNEDVNLNGLHNEEAKEAITEWLEAEGEGEHTVNYQLQDWLFSRQRYWGEPFPIVHDVASGQIYPLAQDELPVTLPPMDDFSPTASDDPDQPPQPPLSKAVAWRLVAGAIMDDGSVRIEEDFPIRELFADGVDVDAAIQKILEAGTDGLAEAADLLAPATVTVDGHECDLRLFTRELNTMPQWAGSCWYYLRYLDPQNKDRFVDPAIERYWMGADNDKAGGVDLYVGGAEHAVLHLLYSRFWHKVLYDLGHVAKPEPFHKLFNQGMILSFAYKDSRGITIGPADIEMKDEGGEPAAYHATTGEKLNKVVAKMSKSLKNVVNPDEIIAQYGADTFRMYEMFMGPLEASKPWNTNDVPGIFRFLQRVWRMILGDKDNNIQPLLDDQTNADVEKALHRLIKKAGEDLEAMKFNTAIAAMMEFVNTVFKAGKISPAQAERLVLVLAPFAPHIAEELWQQLGHDNTLAYEPWPDYDEAMIVEDTVELPVQVNGKVRGRITVAADADEAAVLEAAQDEPNVAGSLEGKTIVKTIVVPGRLVNLVVK
jgi:leucyl-tRNA synthetase